MLDKNPSFLRKKYALDKSPEVQRAAKRTGQQQDVKIPKEARDARIQNYLYRLERVFNPPKREGGKIDRQERNIAMMKRFMHERLIVTPEIATKEYLKYQQRLARERGHGDIEVPDHVQQKITTAVETIGHGGKIQTELEHFSNEEKQRTEEIVARINEQKQSLDSWVDYLASDDANYPDWLKYWVMRSVMRLGSYDKDEKRFPTRDESTTNPFPGLNREALAYVLDSVQQDEDYKQKVATAKEEVTRAEKKHNRARQQQIATRIAELKQQDPTVSIDREQVIEDLHIASFDSAQYDTNLPEDTRNVAPELQEHLNTADFAKLYAWAIEKVTPAAEGILHNTKGEWIKYPQGSDHMLLVQSLQGHGTGWCTAGENVAQSQLSRGDFYVYYSQDEQGNNTIPRVAIRMEDNTIAEVRGIAEDQNIDPYIAPVVQQKMHEFPDGKAYEKKSADMALLTTIEHKTRQQQSINKEELLFLYEVEAPIEGFGYPDNSGKCSDPRIAELRSQRNVETDMLIIFDCTAEQIAHNQTEVTEQTKAYVGPLYTGIFTQLGHLEHLYIQFPERKIRKRTIELGGKTNQQLQTAMEAQGVKINYLARATMNDKEFTTAKEHYPLDTILLTVADLGFTDYCTTTQLFARAQELGLELCPAEIGPHYRLQYTDQPSGEYLSIGMQSIAASDSPEVFGMGRHGNGLWLSTSDARPGDSWNTARKLVFCLRKSN